MVKNVINAFLSPVANMDIAMRRLSASARTVGTVSFALNRSVDQIVIKPAVTAIILENASVESVGQDHYVATVKYYQAAFTGHVASL